MTPRKTNGAMQLRALASDSSRPPGSESTALEAKALRLVPPPLPADRGTTRAVDLGARTKAPSSVIYFLGALALFAGGVIASQWFSREGGDKVAPRTAAVVEAVVAEPEIPAGDTLRVEPSATKAPAIVSNPVNGRARTPEIVQSEPSRALAAPAARVESMDERGNANDSVERIEATVANTSVTALAATALEVPSDDNVDPVAGANVAENPFGERPAGVGENVPDQPSRASVVNIMEGLLPELQMCVGARHGRANAELSVTSSGRVRSVRLRGAFEGSPEGSCMARILRSAQFPEFWMPEFSVSYPFHF